MYVQGFSNNQNIMLKLKSIKRSWCMSDICHCHCQFAVKTRVQNKKRVSCHSKKSRYYNIRFIDLTFSDCLKFNDVVDG